MKRQRFWWMTICSDNFEIAKRENLSVSEVTRKALHDYVRRRRPRRSRLSLVGVGRSGRKDVAERSEELLKKGFGR